MANSRKVGKWTVMVCLAGDNNLSGEMIYAIKEMKRVEKISPDGPVTVIVLFDPSQGLPTQGYVINPGDIDNQLIKEARLIGAVAKTSGSETVTHVREINPAVADVAGTEISRINTGDPETLIQLISDYLNKYPAEHYMIVLSGHGSGAEQDFLLTDDSARDSLTIKELKKVLTGVKKNLSEKKQGRTIDILGLDSCLMSMAEVYYQLGNIESNYSETGNAQPDNLVDFLVGAEGFEMSTGWPYQRVLATLADDPDMLPETFAKTIIEDYILYYSDYALAGQSVDLAACDLRGNNCLILQQKVKTLAQKLKDNIRNKNIKDAVLLAHWEAQSYKFDQYTDLTDFCTVLANRCSRHKEIKLACEGVVDAIGQIVKKSCYSGPAVQYSFGLSVYFPWAQVSRDYKDLEFAKDTDWHEFLTAYVVETRRPPRKECPPSKRPNTSVSDQIFNPALDEFVSSPHELVEPATKFVGPIGKFVQPIDMGPSNRTGSMKNPPIRWCPDNCGRENKK